MNNITRQPIYQKTPQTRFTPEERRYYAWLHAECTCCLTDWPEFHIAHTGNWVDGKGMSIKSGLHTCLPLRFELHLVEEKNRGEFWHHAGINCHLDWARRLHEIYLSGQDPRDLLADMQAKANREYLVGILG